MRLFLHGRSDPAFTVQRIRSYQQQLLHNINTDENDSLSSIMSASLDNGSILLSGFDLDANIELCNTLCELFSSSTTSWSEIKLQNCFGKEGLCRVLKAIFQAGFVSRLVLLHTNHQQCNRLSCAAAQALGEGLSSSSLSCPVQSLVLKGICLPEASMTKIARALGSSHSSLQALTIQGSFTTSELDRGLTCLEKGAATSLAQALKRNTTLQVLELDGTNVTDTSLSQIVMSLSGHPSLSTLSVRGNVMGIETIQALSYILSHQRKQEGALRKLDVSAQRSVQSLYVDEDDDDDEEEEEDVYEEVMLTWAPLFLALQMNPPNLHHLILSDNHLNSNDTHDLAIALCDNTNLKELELSNCCISDRGLGKFCDSLIEMEGLTKLRIDGDQQSFGKSGVKRLIKGLAYNVQLQYITLPVGLDKSRTMQLYLNLNRSGRKYFIPPSPEPTRDGEEENEVRKGKDDKDDGDESSAPTLPQPALWPKVLERAHKLAHQQAVSDEKGREGSTDVLYYLLRGGFLFHS